MTTRQSFDQVFLLCSITILKKEKQLVLKSISAQFKAMYCQHARFTERTIISYYLSHCKPTNKRVLLGPIAFDITL